MRPGLAACCAALLAACSVTGFVADDDSPATTRPPSPSASLTSPASSTPPPSTPPPGTPTATPTASPTPTATPDLGAIELEVTSCNGGTVLRWSPSRHPDFHHYVGLRSPEREIAVQYPPIAPAVDWGDLYATDRFVTSGHDATVVPSRTDWHYRVVAYDARGRPVSRSNVASGRILPYRDLGTLEAEPLPNGGLRLRWDAFDGLSGCFSAYRVLHGTGGMAGTLLTTISDRDQTEVETRVLRAGLSYTLRVEAVRTTTLGHFVVGESEPLTLSLPAPP